MNWKHFRFRKDACPMIWVHRSLIGPLILSICTKSSRFLYIAVVHWGNIYQLPIGHSKAVVVDLEWRSRFLLAGRGSASLHSSNTQYTSWLIDFIIQHITSSHFNIYFLALFSCPYISQSRGGGQCGCRQVNHARRAHTWWVGQWSWSGKAVPLSAQTRNGVWPDKLSGQ